MVTCGFQKPQPNGRAGAEPQEEAMVSEETVPHHHSPPPEVKTEKAAEVLLMGHEYLALNHLITVTYVL